jgi:hypothetical protein
MLSPLLAAADQVMLFLATRQVSGIITFRSIAFGAPNERDRQGKVGMCRSRYRASRRASLILVPATVAAAENVRGGLAQARPSGFWGPAADLRRPVSRVSTAVPMPLAFAPPLCLLAH